MLLCDFPREVLSGITAWLNGAFIANLWCCGNRTLNIKLSQGGAQVWTQELGDSSDAFVFPPLVLKLHGLRTLSILSNSFEHSINLPLAKLPRTLEELSLIMAFLVEQAASCGPLDFAKQFPNMRKMRLSCDLRTLPNWIPSMLTLETLYVIPSLVNPLIHHYTHNAPSSIK